MSDALTELRPPPEHADKPLHWVRQGVCEPTVLHWQPSAEWWTSFGGQSLGAKELDRIGYHYLGPAEWIGADWKPTEADVDSLALALAAGFYNVSFVQAKQLWDTMKISCVTWRREAQRAFDHAGYLPSIIAARKDASSVYIRRIRELEAEVASLCAGIHAEEENRNWSA